jgi:hypothetical protein
MENNVLIEKRSASDRELLRIVENSLKGGIKRDTLKNNGFAFNCDASLKRFKRHLKSDLFKEIEEL